jgi:hypothetical protein
MIQQGTFMAPIAIQGDGLGIAYLDKRPKDLII